MVYYHDGEEDFPHGAGASLPGWYAYPTKVADTEPDGPYDTYVEAVLRMAEIMEDGE